MLDLGVSPIMISGSYFKKGWKGNFFYKSRALKLSFSCVKKVCGAIKACAGSVGQQEEICVCAYVWTETIFVLAGVWKVVVFVFALVGQQRKIEKEGFVRSRRFLLSFQSSSTNLHFSFSSMASSRFPANVFIQATSRQWQISRSQDMAQREDYPLWRHISKLQSFRGGGSQEFNCVLCRKSIKDPTFEWKLISYMGLDMGLTASKILQCRNSWLNRKGSNAKLALPRKKESGEEVELQCPPPKHSRARDCTRSKEKAWPKYFRKNLRYLSKRRNWQQSDQLYIWMWHPFWCGLFILLVRTINNTPKS